MSWQFPIRLSNDRRVDAYPRLRGPTQNPHNPPIETRIGPDEDHPCLWPGCWKRRDNTGLCSIHKWNLFDPDPDVRAIAEDKMSFYQRLIQTETERNMDTKDAPGPADTDAGGGPAR